MLARAAYLIRTRAACSCSSCLILTFITNRGNLDEFVLRPRLCSSMTTCFQSIAYLMLLHYPYTSNLIRKTLKCLHPPAARTLWRVGLGARCCNRLLAATSVRPSCCSISQALCHSDAKPLLPQRFFLFERLCTQRHRNIFSAMTTTTAPRCKRFACERRRISQKLWKRFETVFLHLTLVHKPRSILSFGMLLAATVLPRAL